MSGSEQTDAPSPASTGDGPTGAGSRTSPSDGSTGTCGRWSVVYDGGCGLCRWSVALLLRRDRARLLAPVALGTPRADALLADLAPYRREASWHLVGPDGTRLSAGAALPAVLELLPHGRLPAALLRLIPGPADRGYRWVVEHRSLVGRAIPASARRRAGVLIAQRSRPGDRLAS